MMTDLFERSTEELTGRSSMKNLEYYLHDDVQGAEPSVEFLSAPPPGMVAIYRTTQKADKLMPSRADSDNGKAEMVAVLKQLGTEARTILDISLPETGAVLLRGIPVETAHDFSIFWQACCQPQQEQDKAAWKEAEYVNFGRPRQKDAGVDAATNIPSHLTLNPHNELSYNPVGRAPSRIGLYCLQPSAKGGGESLIALNKDITKQVPPALISHIDQHGGILYERSYRDASRDLVNANTNTTGLADASIQTQLAISWQEKCGLPPEHEGRAEAEQYWVDRGFARELLLWETDGTLRVRNIETGFITPNGSHHSNNDNYDDNLELDGRLWFNNIDTVGECADGSGRPPSHLVQQYQSDRWKATYAWRLEKGDWLVLDNKKVQHGRLPYPTGEDRRLLTVLTV